MRWVIFFILTYLVVLGKVAVGSVISLETVAIGSIQPDLLALLAVFVALHARNGTEAMLAAAVLGLALDLTTAGGTPVGTRVGPMVISYVLAAGLIYRIRDVFFQDHWPTQVVFGGLFCLVSHGLWITLQSMLVGSEASWSLYGRMWLQVVALSVYTAILMPLARPVLAAVKNIFMVAPADRRRRERRSGS
ncbi:MAG: hypothetical protein ACOC93_04690 [Planctomycetota bacterium]